MMSIKELIEQLQERPDEGTCLSAQKVEAFREEAGLDPVQYYAFAKNSTRLSKLLKELFANGQLTAEMPIGVVLTGKNPCDGGAVCQSTEIAWIVCLTRRPVNLRDVPPGVATLVAREVSVPASRIHGCDVNEVMCDRLNLMRPLPGSVKECTARVVQLTGPWHASKRGRDAPVVNCIPCHVPDAVCLGRLETLVVCGFKLGPGSFQGIDLCFNLKTLAVFSDTCDESGAQVLTIDLAGIPLELLEIYGYLVDENIRLPPSLKEFDLDPQSVRTVMDAMEVQHPNVKIRVTVTDEGDEIVHEAAKKLP